MGAWIEIHISPTLELSHIVAPLVGAWIEIHISPTLELPRMSLPLWERGLKFANRRKLWYDNFVAPLVGAWIEILLLIPHWDNIPSLPLWERGLKSFQACDGTARVCSRSPCGSVD